MSRFARDRIVPLVLLMFVLATPAWAGGAVVESKNSPSNIVIGFVGGFVRRDNPHHGPVELAQRIQLSMPAGSYVRVFENRHRKAAYRTILQLLDRDHDGALSESEKEQARIILFGHSWGAAAVVVLARELNRVGIPVLLTVQVDSVAKLWQNDRVIPANVTTAVNFYQTHGIIHGRKKIVAQDPGRTEILGNYLFDYRKEPVTCEGTSWFDRLLTPDHMQSECDPHLWSEVEGLVRERLGPANGTIAEVPQP
ncbi:MAG TPA: hypothetical protein VMB19_08710 [Silvibacterium sp.]|nr:hypothetical protein [Silvibacterium sp.]